MNEDIHSSPAEWFQRFLHGYIICALWSSLNYGDQATSENLDGQYKKEDIDASIYFEMVADCAKFIGMMLDKLATEELDKLDAEKCGHDFWLTRNGHGAGFWDRSELKAHDLGERLTKLCKEFPEYNLLGDGKKVGKF